MCVSKPTAAAPLGAVEPHPVCVTLPTTLPRHFTPRLVPQYYATLPKRFADVYVYIPVVASCKVRSNKGPWYDVEFMHGHGQASERNYRTIMAQCPEASDELHTL